ncbi:hypothetical protein PR003_g33554 [Phytophthora rubi]|uniref:DUF6818 domain-containing protein n=1 Tax=Phytophthora rubi TaxID=129364 RepID=A0A6A4AWH0_9STRA|nr:hypothetical protein PR003_g33554 [Phytophthora rubi]
MLYSARKPTGMPEIPPHIKRAAKEAKQAIDEKANVIEIDDEADRDQGFVEPDFSFEADHDDDYFEGGEGGNGQHGAQGGAGHDEPVDPDESVAGESTGSSAPPSRGEFQKLLTVPFAVDELGSRVQTPRPAPLRAPQNAWQPGSGPPPSHARALPTSLQATAISRRGHLSTKAVHRRTRRRTRSTRPPRSALEAPI